MYKIVILFIINHNYVVIDVKLDLHVLGLRLEPVFSIGRWLIESHHIIQDDTLKKLMYKARQPFRTLDMGLLQQIVLLDPMAPLIIK
jgi:hypothetical protein